MVYGTTEYPGLYGFTIETIGNEIILKSSSGVRYSERYFFADSEMNRARVVIASNDIATLASMTLIPFECVGIIEKK